MNGSNWDNNTFDSNYPDYYSSTMSKAEYMRRHVGKKIRTAAILAYVLIGLNTLLCFMLNPFGLIDMAVYLGLTLGMHLGGKKWCAVAFLIMAIASSLINMLATGNFGGYWWIILGIYAVKVFNDVEKEYKRKYSNDYL